MEEVGDRVAHGDETLVLSCRLEPHCAPLSLPFRSASIN